MPTNNSWNSQYPAQEAAGGTGLTYIPSFNARKSASSLNVTGTSGFYSYVCDTEEFDVGGNYNAGTGVFTAPYTGKYFFSTSVLVQGCTICIGGQIKIVTTTGTYITLFNRAASSSDVPFMISAVVSMTAGDTCYPQVATSGEAGVTDDVYGGADFWTRFGGFWIGA